MGCSQRALLISAWVSYGACITFFACGALALYFSQSFPEYMRILAISQLCVGLALLLVWGVLHGISQHRARAPVAVVEEEEVQLTDVDLE